MAILREWLSNLQYQYLESSKTIFMRVLTLTPPGGRRPGGAGGLGVRSCAARVPRRAGRLSPLWYVRDVGGATISGEKTDFCV